MSFEPQKFFIGLVDFFSVLMPGGFLAYLGKDWVSQALLCRPIYKLNGAEAWMVFLFASYILGHFIFLVGALSDDLIYDPFRSCTDRGQLRRLAMGKNLSPRWLRALAKSRWFFKQNADAAVTQVERLKARALYGLSAGGAVNAFQWAKACLSEKHPEGLAAVQRLEADSKFFRSFLVVLLVMLCVLFASKQWNSSLIIGCLLALSIWRYIDQRFKSTQQAYWFVLTLEGHQSANPASRQQLSRKDRLTHAGGVVCQRRDGPVNYLLVGAFGNPQMAVLPKGHIEAGEDPRETAVREVKEESGYWARVIQWLDDKSLGGDEHVAQTRVYLMELVEETNTCIGTVGKLVKKCVKALRMVKARMRRPAPLEPPDRDWPWEKRTRHWLSLDEAVDKAEYSETKELLRKADQRRGQLEVHS